MDIRYTLELLRPLEATITRRQLEVGCYRIGRDQDCEIQCPVRGLSRRHAELEILSSGGLIIRDLDSTNGTRVNGRPIDEVAVSGDCVLDLGPIMLRLREHDHALAGLAHATGLAVADAAPASTLPNDRTQALSLVSSLRESLWFALAGSDPAVPAGLSRVLAAWLEPLQARGLRLLGTQGEVLAAAGDQALNWQTLADRSHARLDIDAASPMATAPLQRLDCLIDWLPEFNPGVPPPEPPNEPFPGVATTDHGLRRQLSALARVASSKVSILLLGETGVGKDLLAQWLHRCSPRRNHPFIAINCAALPQDLLEAELFGVEEGAATGVSARPGVFERAHLGTLFLDELGDMSLDTQVRLLRALEDGQIHRIGGKQLRQVDIRLISATNLNLEDAMADKRFRLDLYHRVAGFEAVIPPLRDRPGDIAALVIHFFTTALAESGLRSPGITQAALLALRQWPWPGNVRELKQIVQGAVAMLQHGEALDLNHLPARIARQKLDPRQPGGADHASTRLADALAEAERQFLLSAIEASANHEQAWQRLGIGKTSFYKKIKQHGIDRPRLGDRSMPDDY